MMRRETRYMVAKLKDATRYLNENEGAQFDRILDKIAAGRVADGKEPLQCVVVEHDWPEYEPTWQAIERRVDAVPNMFHEFTPDVQARRIVEAVMAEREACAKVCDDACTNHGNRRGGSDAGDSARRNCAVKIRMRSNAPAQAPAKAAHDAGN